MTAPNPPGMHRYPVGGSPATWYEIWDGPSANIQAMPELLQPDTPDFPRVSKQARAIYRLLYEHQNQSLTMLEIREMTEAELGPQEQLDRRRRELNRYFKIVKVAGSSHQKPSGDAAWIAPTDRPPRDGRP